MKFRDSSMPSEELWNTFFTPDQVIKEMNINSGLRTIIDIGCGYGTFLIPLAKITGSKVIGIDIDDNMISACNEKIKNNGDLNIDIIHGDISSVATINTINETTEAVDYITLFNILHCEEPINLLKNAYNLLTNSGRIGVIHWKYEKTPRGPAMDIRPTPKMIIDWALGIGFTLEEQIELQPYHYGLVFRKK